MNKRIFKVMSIALALLLTAAISVSAQKADKKVERDYKISRGFELGIDNKYGSINIVNWEKDELSVVVHIKVESTSEEKAKSLLDKINIEINESSSAVSFDTEFDLKNTGSKNKISVDYEVKAPKYLSVSLEQNYGDIFIQELDGKVGIELNYGDLDATALINEKGDYNSLEVAYGDVDIENLGNMNVELMYGELVVGEAGRLSVESMYSEIVVAEVNELSIESKYDKLSVDYLKKILDVESAYTQVVVGHIDAGFKAMNAEMTYGNLKCEIDEDASYTLGAETKYGSIVLKNKDIKVQKENIRKYAEGQVGNNASASISVSVVYGNFVLD